MPCSCRYFEPYDDGEGHIVGGVRDVFDTVVAALDAAPARKFIVVGCLPLRGRGSQGAAAADLVPPGPGMVGGQRGPPGGDPLF